MTQFWCPSHLFTSSLRRFFFFWTQDCSYEDTQQNKHLILAEYCVVVFFQVWKRDPYWHASFFAHESWYISYLSFQFFHIQYMSCFCVLLLWPAFELTNPAVTSMHLSQFFNSWPSTFNHSLVTPTTQLQAVCHGTDPLVHRSHSLMDFHSFI